LKANGCIYDAYIENGQLTVYLRTERGVLQLHDQFPVEFYATSAKRDLNELAEILSSHPLVESATLSSAYLKITDKHKSTAIQVVGKPEQYRKLIWDLQSSDLCTLYNTDLSPVQWYFFDRHFRNFADARVDYDDQFRIIKLNEGDNSATPNLDVLTLEPENRKDELISQLAGPEFQILVVRRDQRPLVYELLRSQKKSNYSYSRLVPGKLIVDKENFRKLGVAGLDEKSKFAFLPIGVVAAWGSARTIDSRQCYEAVRRGILIPGTRAGTGGNVLTAKEIAYTDRGALILSPQIGLHENIGELDFESLFPSILVKENISYETASSFGIDQSSRGFLPDLVEQIIQKRRTFKHAKQQFGEGTRERRECEQRERLLKKLLVSLYGYSSSDLNRFGNVFVYREINRIAREIIVDAMNIALKDGFRVIYLDTDSIFVERQNATRDDFEKLAERISQTLKFEIALTNHYRYLVLLTQEADHEIEAARRFYGKLTNGEVYYRGIELRRHDYPSFMKHFQEQLLNILLCADKAPDVQERQLPKAIEFTSQMVDELRLGNVPLSELVISKVLRMPVARYRSLFPHVTAAVQLRQKHRPVRVGDLVNYVYVDTGRFNPINRVAPTEFAESYDVEKYVEMLLDVAESILGIFGFSRKRLGFPNRSRNFLDELRSERTREILTELEELQP